MNVNLGKKDFLESNDFVLNCKLVLLVLFHNLEIQSRQWLFSHVNIFV